MCVLSNPPTQAGGRVDFDTDPDSGVGTSPPSPWVLAVVRDLEGQVALLEENAARSARELEEARAEVGALREQLVAPPLAHVAASSATELRQDGFGSFKIGFVQTRSVCAGSSREEAGEWRGEGTGRLECGEIGKVAASFG